MNELVATINLKFANQLVHKDSIYAKRKIPNSHFKAQNIWILKATGFNRGIGIHVFNKLEDLKKLIKEYTDGVNFENQYENV
jgi:phosphoribosylamine-glycine ligase